MKNKVHYFVDGAIIKNEKNSEIYRIILYSRTSVGHKILTEKIDELNKIKPQHIATAVQIIQGKQKGLGGFLYSNKS